MSWDIFWIVAFHLGDLVNTCCDWLFIGAGMGRFRQHKLRHYLSAHWHEIDLINTCWGVFFVFAGIGWIWSKLAFCVLACMEGVWSTHDKMHLLPSLAMDELVQYTLRFILCPCLHLLGFVNSCDAFCVLAGLRWVWSTHVIRFCVLARIGCDCSSRVEMHFMYYSA